MHTISIISRPIPFQRAFAPKSRFGILSKSAITIQLAIEINLHTAFRRNNVYEIYNSDLHQYLPCYSALPIKFPFVI